MAVGAVLGFARQRRQLIASATRLGRGAQRSLQMKLVLTLRTYVRLEPRKEISDVIERFTFHDEDSSFCVLRIKTEEERRSSAGGPSNFLLA